MPKITSIKARQVFDSRGMPTISTEILLNDGSVGSAIVPSGASTGTYESFELRDIENKNYLGKSVLKAIEKVNNEISKKIVGLSAANQKNIDEILIELDGTKQKKNLGANSILSVSLAVNDDLSLSYEEERSEANQNVDSTADVEQKSTGIQAAYNMGGMTLALSFNSHKNIGYSSTAVDVDQMLMAVTLAF